MLYMTSEIIFLFFYFNYYLISCRIFLCSLTLSNTSAVLTWSVQRLQVVMEDKMLFSGFGVFLTFRKPLWVPSSLVRNVVGKFTSHLVRTPPPPGPDQKKLRSKSKIKMKTCLHSVNSYCLCEAVISACLGGGRGGGALYKSLKITANWIIHEVSCRCSVFLWSCQLC
jgi:hypothetical protein